MKHPLRLPDIILDNVFINLNNPIHCHNKNLLTYLKTTMTHKLALFWILWGVLLVVMVGCCIFEGWSEDTALLGGTYALSLLSTWLCHKAKPKAAFVNLIVMIAYNAILSYNLVFNSQYGAGLTWWFFALLLNTIHSIGLMIFVLLSTQKRNL